MAKTRKIKFLWYRPTYNNKFKELPQVRKGFTEPVTYSVGKTVKYERRNGHWYAERLDANAN